jgi:hypothetical protein
MLAPRILVGVPRSVLYHFGDACWRILPLLTGAMETITCDSAIFVELPDAVRT